MFGKTIIYDAQWQVTPTFFLYFSTLYSPSNLTYRGLGRAIPLHALQTTNMVFLWLIATLAHLFHSSIMHFLSNFETVVYYHKGAFSIVF